MRIKPIKTEKDHDAALRRIEQLLDAKDRTSVDDLDVLATLVEVHEDEHHPMVPSPIRSKPSSSVWSGSRTPRPT